MAGNNFTNIDQSYFERSVERLDGSGGTASFFRLELTKKGTEYFGTNDGTISHNCFIGKEFSEDEAEFYEQQKLVMKESIDDDSGGGMSKLLEYTFKYVGIVTLQKEMDQPHGDRKLLVLKSLLGTYTKHRWLQFKIGKNAEEGFRLERFDGQPKAVTSRDPRHDFKVTKKSKERKTEANSKAQRKVFQRMSLSDVLMHYLDLHEEPDGGKVSASSDDVIPSSRSLTVEDLEEKKMEDLEEKKFLSLRSEVAEIVLDETVQRLGNLLSACHSAGPQKWLGTSIGIGYDTGNFFPNPGSSEQRIRSNVIVCMFDWERSKLRCKELSKDLSKKGQDNLKTSWELYTKGIDNLLYHAAKRYHNEFSNIYTWNKITVRVMDYDSSSSDDFMGEVTIPFPKESSNVSGEYLLKKKGNIEAKKTSEIPVGKRGCIKLKMSWQAAPLTSRLKGSWHITIVEASKLQIKDVLPKLSSDPYCLVRASSKGDDGDYGYLEFQQQTKVITESLDPFFGETLEVPVSKKTYLADSLSKSLCFTVDPLKTKNLFGTGISENNDSQYSLEAYAQLCT